MASSVDVAKLAGVSQSTVSRVFRDVPGIRASTRQKVLDAAYKLDYSPNEAARNLVTGTTNQISLIVENLRDPSFTEFIDTISLELRSRDRRMMLLESDQPDGSLSKAAARALDAADGVVIASPHLDARPVSEWIPSGMPHVYAYRRPADVLTPGVFPDHDTGIELAISHLTGLGHRAIALVGGDNNVHAGHWRARAFRQAIARRGMSEEACPVVFGDGRYEDGYHIASRLLSGSNRPTAIFAASDLVAFGVLGAAADMGVPVPSQLSVVGFDNQTMASWPNFRLTTVATSHTDMAHRTVSILFDLLNGTNSSPVDTPIESRLVVRHTTAAPAL